MRRYVILAREYLIGWIHTMAYLSKESWRDLLNWRTWRWYHRRAVHQAKWFTEFWMRVEREE